MAALLAGDVQMSFSPPFIAIPMIKAGKIKAIAVSGERRLSALPQVPTFAEAGLPGMDMKVWFGVLAPAGTPKDVITRINAEFNKALKTPELSKRLSDEGADPAGGTPEQFVALIKDDIPRWGKLVKESGAKVD